MAAIHHGLAGHGEIGLGHFIQPAAPLHRQPGPAQHGEMLEGVVVAAAGDLGHLINGARFAVAQGPEHLPAGGMAEGAAEPFEVGARRFRGGFRRFRGRIHAKQGISRQNDCQPGTGTQPLGTGFSQSGFRCCLCGLRPN